LLTQLWEVNEGESLDARGLAEFHRALATLIAAGAMMSALLFPPRQIKWDDVPQRLHPPAVARVVGLSWSLSAALREGLPHLDDVSHRWIWEMCLEIA
jgi:hypothetical protein